MEIRKAIKTDNYDIIVLTQQLGYTVDKNTFINQFYNILEKSDHAIFVAENNDKKVIAYIHVLSKELLISIASVEIGELIVDEKYRREGIGKQLIQKVDEWAIENGYQNVTVGSSNKRTTSHLFYPNAGFSYWKEQILYSKALGNDL
jgi:GNAT superfamily N-acetyltransferase